MESLEDLLAESAPLARRLAPQLCYTDPASGENCAWYHGFLPYLRRLGLVASPAHHGEFFAEAFRAVATAARQPRVLVSGAADHCMLEQVVKACRTHDLAPQITVLDVCETPLGLNRWYAGRAGIAIETLRRDVLEFQRPGAFDVVCTHSLLGRFSPEERPALMAGWRRLLAHGGRVITVNRVRARTEQEKVGFNAGHTQALRAAVLAGARGLAGRLDVGPEKLASEADAYAARHRVHPVRSQEEMRGLFESAGFIIEQLDLRQAAKADAASVSGPTMLDGSHYACVVARSP